jgi:hypothetical protein
MLGCSAQYEENSVREVDERMKGGAVRDERSPEKDAILYVTCVSITLYSRGRNWNITFKNVAQPCFWPWGTAPPSTSDISAYVLLFWC